MACTSPTPHQLAAIGTLLAEPARAAMLLALIDGTARPTGELARAARVGAPAARAHLERLLEGGLLAVQAQGRHRYYRLAGDEVTGWLEALALSRTPVTLAPPTGDAALAARAVAIAIWLASLAWSCAPPYSSVATWRHAAMAWY